ncbi:MAG: Cysteine desulfurase family protein, partial [Parcubacteria group bacterium GW2011_GWA2_45_15]
PEVRRVMEKYWSKDFYNPNAIYEEGVRIKKDVDEYRAKIARILGVAKEAIIFTSGGTEANTWAVRGVKPGRIVVEQDSHPSVSEAAKDITGEETTLISSTATDNELGRKIREERKKGNTEFPLLHIDASQTAGYFNVGLEALACDLLTLDAAKLYGPKGIGALVVKRGVKLDLPPLGTPAVPLIAGFVKALEIAVRDRALECKRLDSLSVEFIELIEQSLPQTLITRSLPNVVHVLVPGILPEFLVLALDRAGVLVSAGPACNSNKPEPPDTPVRFSFGRYTTFSEVRRAAEIFCKICRSVVK